MSDPIEKVQTIRGKNVTLLRPPMLVPTLTFSGLTVPPLGLAYISSSLKSAGHFVTLIDAVGEAIGKYQPVYDNHVIHGLKIEEVIFRIPKETDVIGISCMFSHEFPVYREWISKLREHFPLCKMIAGGEHVTALPHLTLEQCPGLDVIVMGEGEETAIEVLASDFSEEALQKIQGIVWRSASGIRVNPRRGRIREIDKIPRPDWKMVPLENYWKKGMGLGVNRGRSMPLLATRGCPYQCTFCSNPLMWTPRWTARTPLEVIQEIKYYIDEYKIDNFDFYDLTAFIYKRWIVEFCNLIELYQLKFTYQLPSGTRSEAIDQEVAKLLYKSGCRNMTYAPESGSKRMLKVIKKRVSVKGMFDSMRACVKEGLNIKTNIIVGFPGETWSDLFETYLFLFRMAIIGVHDVTIQPYSAYPGTELFDQLVKEKNIELDDNFYLSLTNLADLKKSSSWSEHVSGRSVFWYRTIGMLSFYAFSYFLRPLRVFMTLFNLINNKQESRIERALADIFQRNRAIKFNIARVFSPPYV